MSVKSTLDYSGKSLTVGHLEVLDEISGPGVTQIKTSIERANLRAQAAGQTAASIADYWIFAPEAIYRQADGSYNPATVSIQAKRKVGANSPALYSGRFVVSDTTDGATYIDRYTSTVDQSAISYAPMPGIAGLRIRLYETGGTVNLLDELIVPAVSMGASVGTYLGMGRLDQYGLESATFRKVAITGAGPYSLVDAGDGAAAAGDWIFDTANKAFYLWDGAAWGTSGVTSRHRAAGLWDLLALGEKLPSFASTQDLVAFYTTLVTSDLFANYIKAGAIGVDKLDADVLNALLANISQALVVDPSLGFSAGGGATEGSLRAYLNEKGLSFERFLSGVWDKVAGISEAGALSTQFYSEGPLYIGNNTQAGRRANGFDLGVLFPTGAKVFHFDGDSNDQNGVAWWTITGAPAYDWEDQALAAIAPAAVEGAAISGTMKLEKALTGFSSGSWWFDVWIKIPAVDAELVRILGPDSQIRLVAKTDLYGDAQGSAAYPYTDPGASGQIAYFAEPPVGNVALEAYFPGGSFRQKLTLSGWVHLAIGYNATTGELKALVGLTSYNVGALKGGDAFTITLNSALASMKYDEAMFVASAIDLAMAAANTAKRIPWAATSYADRVAYLDAYDKWIANKLQVRGLLEAGSLNALDPDNFEQNLVRSGSNEYGGWVKYPDGTMIQTMKIQVTGTAAAFGVWTGWAPKTVTLPLPFYDTNYLLWGKGDGSYGAWMSGELATTKLVGSFSGYLYNIYNAAATAGSNSRYNILAIGRWKA